MRTPLTLTAAALILGACASGISTVQNDQHKVVTARDSGTHVTTTTQWAYVKEDGVWKLVATFGNAVRGYVSGPFEAGLSGAAGAVGAGALIKKGLGNVKANPTVNTDINVQPPAGP